MKFTIPSLENKMVLAATLFVSPACKKSIEQHIPSCAEIAAAIAAARFYLKLSEGHGTITNARQFYSELI